MNRLTTLHQLRLTKVSVNIRIYAFLLFACLPSIFVAQTTWQPTAAITGFESTFLFPFNEKIFAGLAGAGIYATIDGGETWQPSSEGIDDPYIMCMFKRNDVLWAGSLYGRIYSSLDKGDSWQLVYKFPAIHSVLSFSATSENLFAGTSIGVFKALEDGQSWEKCSLPIPTDVSTSIYEMVAWEGNIVAASSANVFFSIDNGQTWAESITGAGNDLMVLKRVNDLLYIGDTGDGIFESNDGGLSWVKNTPTGAADEVPGVGIVTDILPTENGLMVASSANLFMDAANIKEGLPESGVSCLLEHQGALYAGTYFHGIYKYQLSGVIDPLIKLPDNGVQGLGHLNASLSIYPNPTNNILVLEGVVTQAGNTTILLTSEGGGLIQSYELGYLQKGQFNHKLDIGRLPSGRYHIILKQEGIAPISKPFYLLD